MILIKQKRINNKSHKKNNNYQHLKKIKYCIYNFFINFLFYIDCIHLNSVLFRFSDSP